MKLKEKRAHQVKCPEDISDEGEENPGLGSLLEGTEVFNFMEKISNTINYWTKTDRNAKKLEEGVKQNSSD